MQSIHHVVMTTLKVSINPGRLQDHEFEGAFQVIPTLPVGERYETVKTRGCSHRGAVEAHCKRAAGEVVGTQIPCGLHVERADRPVLVRAFRNSENGVDQRSRVRTITQVYSGQAEVVGWS